VASGQSSAFETDSQIIGKKEPTPESLGWVLYFSDH
jgi:hypothetical protein